MCSSAVPLLATDGDWQFVMNYKAEGTIQNKSLTLGEWGRAGCTYLPSPAICHEIITIDTSVYFDRKIIKKNNKRLKWVLFDYSQRTNDNDQSNSLYIEIDCERWAYIELAKYGYDQPMGRGKPLLKNASKEWVYPPPNTTFLNIIQKACSG
jgi:hypothetical protein